MIIWGIVLSQSDLWLLGVCGVLIMALIGYRLTINAQKHNAFIVAATIFRSNILNSLEGVYPITRTWWNESTFPIFQQSVPKIETAAAEFRHSIKRKTELAAAVKKYHDYCQQGAYKKGTPHLEYPNSPKPPNNGIDPIEEFKNIVEHILSFAEVK